MSDIDFFLAYAVAPVLDLPVKQRRWTAQEYRFLEENLGKLSYEEIGAVLQRPALGVKIKQVRQQLPAPSKRPGWLTGHRTARALGQDVHAIAKMAERGILPCVVLPGQRGILMIRKVRLYMWAINPENWIYFKVHRIRDLHLKRLVELAQARWGDEWMTVGAVAQYYEVDIGTVNQNVHRGKLPAKKWGNWFLKRSDVELYQVGKGKGGTTKLHARANWSVEADAFLLRCRQDGLTWKEIAKLMKRQQRAVAHHGQKLIKASKGESK